MRKEESRSIKKNYLLNIMYNIFNLIIPLVTTPYISATLLPVGVGQYSYTFSVSSYFCLFSQLGLGYYAQREIAKYQDDKYTQSLIFWEIMTIKFVTTGFSCFIYIILCGLHVFGAYTFLMWFWIFSIIAQFFDIAFLFQGNEHFSKIVFRNLIIKILGISVIFLFVKSVNDVWIYILSNSLCGLLGVWITWTYLPRYLIKINKKDINFIRHIKPTILLFIPMIATTLSAYLDRTFMGILIKDKNVYGLNNSDIEIGFYEQTDRIIKIGASVITSLGTVMLPRNTNTSTQNINKVIENIYKSLRFSFMIAIPIMFGFISISSILVPWFLGQYFIKCIWYIRLYSPMVVLFGIENIFGVQYLMAIGKDLKYSVALLVGVAINCITNYLLIPNLWGTGAIICTILSELIVDIILLYMSKKILHLKIVIQQNYKYLFSGIIMLIITMEYSKLLLSTVFNTILLIFCGVIVYFFTLFLFKDELLIHIIDYLKFKFLKK